MEQFKNMQKMIFMEQFKNMQKMIFMSRFFMSRQKTVRSAKFFIYAKNRMWFQNVMMTGVRGTEDKNMSMCLETVEIVGTAEG